MTFSVYIFSCWSYHIRIDFTNNYGNYINQFSPNTINPIWQYERINKKICRQKMFIIFNEICIYIYIYIYVCVCVCVCVFGFWFKERKNIYFKRNRSTRGFIFQDIYFSSTRVSGVLYPLQKAKLLCSCVSFDLYSGDCFDQVVILFISRTSVCEFSVRVNYPWKFFCLSTCCFSLTIFSSYCFSFSKSAFYVFICQHTRFCQYMCIYFRRFFLFLFHYSSSP